jgi:hypothetical protein
MISSRCRIANPLDETMRPRFDPAAKAKTPRSISPRSRTSMGLSSTPQGDATAWIAPHWPVPAGLVASRSTAARVMPGTTSLRTSSHFPLTPYSKFVKPVALPPGRARLATKPAPTGSAVCVNTIGTVRVASCNGPMTWPPLARMTSGVSATNSTASLRMRATSPPPQR